MESPLNDGPQDRGFVLLAAPQDHGFVSVAAPQDRWFPALDQSKCVRLASLNNPPAVMTVNSTNTTHVPPLDPSGISIWSHTPPSGRPRSPHPAHPAAQRHRSRRHTTSSKASEANHLAALGSRPTNRREERRFMPRIIPPTRAPRQAGEFGETCDRGIASCAFAYATPNCPIRSPRSLAPFSRDAQRSVVPLLISPRTKHRRGDTYDAQRNRNPQAHAKPATIQHAIEIPLRHARTVISQTPAQTRHLCPPPTGINDAISATPIMPAPRAQQPKRYRSSIRPSRLTEVAPCSINRVIIQARHASDMPGIATTTTPPMINVTATAVFIACPWFDMTSVRFSAAEDTITSGRKFRYHQKIPFSAIRSGRSRATWSPTASKGHSSVRVTELVPQGNRDDFLRRQNSPKFVLCNTSY